MGLNLYNVRQYNSASGRSKTRQVFADDPQAAKAMSFEMDGDSTSVELADAFSAGILKHLVRSKASPKELKAFYANMYAAMRVDDSFTGALAYTLVTVEGTALKNAIYRTLRDLREKTAERALENFSGVIPDEHLASIGAGYKSGALVDVLKHLSIAMDKQSKILKKIIVALVQPGIVVVLSIIIALGMTIVILPKIVGTLVGFGGEIPALTQFFLTIGEFAQARPYLSAAIGLIPVFGVTQIPKFIRSRPGQFILQRLPGIGELFFKGSMGSALTTLGLLLDSGITTQDALKMVSKVGKHSGVTEFFVRMDEALMLGKDFFASASHYSGHLGKEGASFVALLKMGRDKGNLGDIVSRLGAQYTEEVDMKVETVEKFINPIAMVLAGGMVLVVVMAIVMPMTNIYTNIL